jgi:hypothetical protein
MRCGPRSSIKSVVKAKIPASTTFKPGNESVDAGKGMFYVLRYGAYLIAMNCTEDRTFTLDVPQDFRGAKDLANESKVPAGPSLRVGAHSTVVLWNGDRK